jgi:squalene cyclase
MNRPSYSVFARQARAGIGNSIRAAVITCMLFGSVMPVAFRAHAQKLFEGSGVLPQNVEAMYVKGLNFLSRSQAEDGSWPDINYGNAPGVVGLAVVAMLAHGDNPNWGPYALNIRRGIDYILNNTNDKTGYIGTSMYNHGFATLCLAEAYGEVDDPRLGPALKKAVECLLESQKDNPRGAWRYSPTSKDADTTVSGAQMVALFAARNAGIAVPEDAIQKGLRFFRECQHASGGIGYTSNSSPNAPRTAIMCLVFGLAREHNSDEYRRAWEFLSSQPYEQSSYRFYYLYYASQAFFRNSTESWEQFNRQNTAWLMENQNEDGSWNGQFGSVFTTSASLLSLALNYRYLPIYER